MFDLDVLVIVKQVVKNSGDWGVPNGGKVSSAGSPCSGGIAAAGGQTTGSGVKATTGGSTSKADAGTNTQSSISGGCSIA